MLATEVKGLRPVYCEMQLAHSDEVWLDSGELAWRVLITDDRCVFPMRFARERDAQAAIAAVADMGDWVNDWQRLTGTRAKEIKERFSKAMAW